MCSGSHGGGGGRIEYAEYLENMHKSLVRGVPIPDSYSEITNDVYAVINTIHGLTTPYEGESAYDPTASDEALFDATSPLGRIREAWDSLEDLVFGFGGEWTNDETTEFANFVAVAAGELDHFSTIDFITGFDSVLSDLMSHLDTVVNEDHFKDMVDSFEDHKEARFLRGVGTWAAGMADVNAVNSSSFIIGLALLQQDITQEVDAYERELKHNLYGNVMAEFVRDYLKAKVMRVASEDQMVLQGTQIIHQLRTTKAELYSKVLVMKEAVEKLVIIAKKEQEDRDIAIDVEHTLWDLEVLQYGGNAIAAIAGATGGRSLPKVSKEQSALGMAAQGLGAAALLGAGAPLAIGVGAVAGLIGWAMGD